jgi:hypothetical protein
MLIRIGLTLALVLSLVPTARAWSYKEHILLTRLAATRIIDDPQADPALRDWLRSIIVPITLEEGKQFMVEASVGNIKDEAGLEGLLAWVSVPDILAGRRDNPDVQPFGAHERLLHYIDLELLNEGDAPREYRDDLSTLPPRHAIPRDMTDERLDRAGFLPFAVEHAHTQLVESLRAGKLGPDGALRWAGYLSHYAQDNTQPHHATVDYKSASYFGGRPDAPNVHSEMEWRPVDDPTQPLPALRQAIWLALERHLGNVSDPAASDDPFEATLDVAYASYRFLPMIGAAAVSASHQIDGSLRVDTERFYAYSTTIDGEAFSMVDLKGRQLALAVQRTERLLRNAWTQANP